MTKQKMWVKKRTSRGGGRQVNRRERCSVKNIDRDIRKNQLIYSVYLLKFVIIFVLGLLWVNLGVAVGPFRALPIGLMIGLLIIGLERIHDWRCVELAIILTSSVLSFFFPIAMVL